LISENYTFQSDWFPEIPNDSDSLIIDYYWDNFLGDYSLEVIIKTDQKSYIEPKGNSNLKKKNRD